MKKVRVLVQGQVQRVGFRYWTKGKLNKFKIEGEVWNNEDGTVGVEFEGDEKQIEKMMEILKKGPPLAKVRHVDILKLDEV